MSHEESFSPDEESFLLEIVLEALLLDDERERETLIRVRCKSDPRLIRRATEDLQEMLHGERSRSTTFIKLGEEIGNYRVMKVIGVGGFATVYSAEHKISKTFAAIKVFDRFAEETEKDILWNKEGKSLSKLDHDNIVKFYDLGFHEKAGKTLPYVIVELVKGKHLDEHCKAANTSVREVLRLFRSLCGVISYIHNQEKILHLDLKPSNIFVTARRPYSIKLIDFGSSKLFRNEPRRLTRNDFINPLSIKFASPEQFDRKADLDHQSDIYSLGAVLYLLFTESVPFGEDASSIEEIKRDVTDMSLVPELPSRRVLKIKKDDKFELAPRKLSRVLKGDLDAIIMKCLEKHRRKRYPTAVALSDDLHRFLIGRAVSARKHLFGYRIYKLLLRLLGFKGGFSGWAKWRTPTKRVAALAVLGAALGVGYKLIRPYFLTPDTSNYVAVPKTIETKQIPLRVRKDDNEVAEENRNAKYIQCAGEPCFTFMEIQGGSFSMGQQAKETFGLSPKEERIFKLHEKVEEFLKPHTVFVPTFYLGRFEVTNRQWNIVARMPKKHLDMETVPDDDSAPKTDVSYARAQEFCERLSGDLTSQMGRPIIVRLPSEAEWEYACRANGQKRFGSVSEYNERFINAVYVPPNAPRYAELLLNKVRLSPLDGSAFDANLFGLSAMSGNVWEIVADSWHRGDANSPPQDGSAWNPIVHIPRQDEDIYYVLRGGASQRLAYMSQCFYRTKGRYISPGNEQTGFRVVLEEKSGR